MARISPQGVRDLNVVMEVLHENGAVNSPSMGERYNLGGRVALATGGAWKGPKSEAAREAAYKKIFEAQKEFVKKNKRLPTREEIIKITKSGPLAIRSAMKKYGFQLFNKPGEFKTPPEKKEASYKKRTETVRSQKIDEPKTIKTQGKRVDVRFPSPSIKEAFITDLSGRFEYPKGSVEGKGKFLTNADLLEKYYKGKKGFDSAAKLNEHINLIVKEQGFKYPLQTYEGHRKVEEINKKRRLKFIKQTSSPKIEAMIKNLKIGEKVDLAHRMSLKEVAKLGTDYLATSLGWDQTKVNQEIVRPFENKIGRLYDRRSKLIKNLVPGEVPKNIQVEIENINKQVSELVDRTKGRLHGILINEKNLKPIRYGVDHSTIVGFGLIKDKPVSKLTQADLIMAELNLPQQIKQEKINIEGIKTLSSNKQIELVKLIEHKAKGTLTADMVGKADGTISKILKMPLNVITKAILPFLLPGPSLLLEGIHSISEKKLPDVTGAETWLGPAFWADAMTGLGVTKDTLGHKILRAGMKPSTVAKVSRFSGPALMATAAVDRGKAMANTFKKAEALGIDVSQYVDRSSGVIEVTDELYDEIRKRESGQGMNYFNGGIASLR